MKRECKNTTIAVKVLNSLHFGIKKRCHCTILSLYDRRVTSNRQEEKGYMENVQYGFGYDLWVFCLGQEKRTTDIPGNTNIRIAEHGDTRLRSIYGFTCDCEGQFYNLTTKAEELCGTLFLKENDTLNSNRNKEHHFSFPWMTQEEKDDIKYLSFAEEYIESLSAF